jgi:hypothetical protein
MCASTITASTFFPELVVVIVCVVWVKEPLVPHVAKFDPAVPVSYTHLRAHETV